MSRRPCFAGTALAAAATLFLAACTPGTEASDDVAPSGQEAKGSIEFWHFFTDREAKAIDDAIAQFSDAHPDIDVRVTAGQDDAKMLQAISSGKGPDVGLSYSTDIVGKFCSSGAWRDLTPYIERDEIDLEQFPATVRSYTSYHDRRCAMPFLADVYGLYYNKTLLAQAGYTEPPKTMTELADMAKKLTKRAPDGTIEVAGYVPLLNFYEHTPQHIVPGWDAKWLTADEKSAIGTDPQWQAMLKWHKDLVDWYGYDNLQKFTAGLGDEWSADNAFHKGKLAMSVDGEYRVAFLTDQAPDVDFGTAPLPVADDQADRYGAGFVTGNVAGISANSKNPEASWALIEYLTTETGSIVGLSNAIKNVPTTSDALASPDLQVDEKFKVFLDIFEHPETSTTPPNASGPKYVEMAQEYVDGYLSGANKDLASGLADLDTRIDQALDLGR
ncbi:ABC transporter substrate-binding protein [Actinophytocola algeriensis]|uniref:Multiple sugar transport system substrate-binding protein n=1 Tax=Actinophytocola algeriensis TaxID=1768010 RepID=A0A7W7QGG7_9PSEU|nr:ABC transporter substrate-binding protein [Actinophytocola algeriensis]MBB4912611.1 multiple sugar transport system substrate-binding protein [Actinophytocola algeriensis]MBE1478985.1 multiple sugar transport system substrate-binding protein [Actinophytocola algeriensis]